MLRASSTASVAWVTAPVQFPADRSASANRGNANSTRPIAPSLRAWVSMRLKQPAEAVVVAEVEGRDPEVGQQVRLGQVFAEGDGLPQGHGGGGQAIVVQLVEPGEQDA